MNSEKRPKQNEVNQPTDRSETAGERQRRDLTFRVFVSSTFSDLKAERDALQKNAFVKLREYCQQHGARFQPIDLRWGISREAALDQQTMSICFEELRRCQDVSPKPNFIILLGQRYGWRPLPARIVSTEFRELLSHVDHPDDRTLLRGRADVPAWRHGTPPRRLGWYREDLNAVPREFILQARRIEYPSSSGKEQRRLIAKAEEKDWFRIEARLRRILLNAIRSAGWLQDDPRLPKYIHSATHQEIQHGALQAREADKHVFAYYRDIKGTPPADMMAGFIDGDADRTALDALKAELGRTLPADHRFDYPADWKNVKRRNRGDGEPILIDNEPDLKQLCDRVYGDMKSIIDSELAQFSRGSELEREQEAHRQFGAERGAFFQGREGVLRKIRAYLNDSSDTKPLIIHGTSGCGKTALMAKAASETSRSAARAEDSAPVVRFIGATPGSADLRSLLYSLCEELGVAEIPQETKELVRAFRRRLSGRSEIGTQRGETAAVEPAIVFLDAIDQLSDTDNALTLHWLPRELAPGVKLILSIIEPERNVNEIDHSKLPDRKSGVMNDPYDLARRNWPGSLVSLSNMNRQDGEMLLDSWLNHSHRGLQPEQRADILAKFVEDGRPLFLRLAFEEARLWHSWEGLPCRADNVQGLGKDVRAILIDMLNRLEQRQNHGRKLVEHALSNIATGKNGLTEDELLDVLSAEDGVMEEFRDRNPDSPEIDRLPVIIWSRLHADLRPYMTERQADGANVMAFYHRQVAEAVHERYLKTPEARFKAHKRLSAYFASLDYWAESPNAGRARADRLSPPPRSANVRKVVELPYHMLEAAKLVDPESNKPEAAEWDAITDLLTDFEFLEAKCEAGLVHELVADHNAALRALPEFAEENAWLAERDAAMFAYNRALRDYAVVRYKWFQARERGPVRPEPPYPALPEELRDEAQRAIAEETSPRAARLRQFANFVSGHLALLSQFPTEALPLAYNWAREGPVAGSAEIRIAQHTMPWLRRSPRPPSPPLRPQCLRTLEGHSGEVTSVSVCPDGERAVSGSWDKTVRLWDLETGECLRTLEGHSQTVWSVSVSPDGRRAVSGGKDGTVRLWDLQTGECLRMLEGHSGWVDSVSVCPDGRRAVSMDENSVRLWDLETGRCLRTLESHGGWHYGISLCPDGQRAVRGSSDGTVRLWDLETGRCLRTLEGHSNKVVSVSVSPDGRRAVSGSEDRTARLWDLETGECLRTLEGHSGSVGCVSVSPDGRRAITSDYECVRLWDLETGTCERTLEGHGGWVNSVIMCPDGRRAVSMDGNNVRLWDLETRVCERTLEGHSDRVCSVSVSRDGRHAVSGSFDKTVRVWNLETGGCVRTLEGHSDKVSTVSLCPDGRRAVSGSFDNSVRLWDLETGDCLRTLEDSHVLSVIVCSDGRRVLSGSFDKTIRVWNLETGSCMRTLEGHRGPVVSVSVSPDGRRAVSGSSDETVRLWDLETGECLRTLVGHESYVDCVSVCPDGRRAVSGSSDQTVRIWDLKTGECLRTLVGHSQTVWSVSVSPDGRHAVSGSEDKTVRLWDLETGRCLSVYHGGESILAVAFSPDGTRIVCGTIGGQMHFLTPVNLPPAESTAPPAAKD